MNLQEGKSRLDLVKAGVTGELGKRGRLLVSIEKVLEDPKNERRVFRNMDGLVSSVKELGLVEPLTVTAEPDGTYRINTGARRYRAAKAAGLQTIEVIIRDPEDERRRRLKSIVSNVQREDVGPVEMAEALQSLLDDSTVESQQKLAKAIGKDKTWVSQMLRILDLPLELRRKVETSQLSLPYDAVTKIARLSDRGQQEHLTDALLNGATARDIRERIKELKGKAEAPKPKIAFSTRHEATVIVQSMTQRGLSAARCAAALQEALKQARARK